MTEITNEKQQEHLIKEPRWETIGITNSLLFKHLMKNEEICKELLETILGIKIRKLNYKDVEKEMDLSLDAKSVRLDVYVEDSEPIAYDLEMQATDTRELPKRSRYYQGMIDLNLINKGMPYSSLRKSYIIFICPFDLFGQGRSIYTFEHICLEDKEIRLGDDATKIFLNASSTGEDVSEELRAFLKYIKDQTIDSKFVEKINKEVKQIKESREWRREYMSLYAHDCDVMERGIRQGIEQGRAEGELYNAIKLIMKKHGKMNSNDLAQFLECDEKLVSEIFGVMDDKNGQVSAEELYEVLFNHK